MVRLKYIKLLAVVLFLLGLQGCKESEDTNTKQIPWNGCRTIEPIARSINTDCNIQFWDIMFKYTYVRIESLFYTVGAPCNESVFQIKYINSKHEHNEPDYTFKLKMNSMKRDEFFKPGSIKVNGLSIYDEQPAGGVESPYSNVDVTLIWDEVSLIGNVYSGKGRIVFNKDIPHFSYANYKYPAQEIPFEFHERNRERP